MDKQKNETMKILMVLVLFLATAFAAAGQATKTSFPEPMKALNFLVGKWQGKVKYEPGTNQYQEALWTAHVYYNVGGSILIIDEKGSEIDNKDNTTVEVLVVVYWDSAAREYPARLYWSSKSGAGSAEGKVIVQDNTFELQMNDGINRFTVRLNEKGQWHEVGDVSDDGGKSWKRRFEMTLHRQD